jgi:hypothetical protein
MEQNLSAEFRMEGPLSRMLSSADAQPAAFMLEQVLLLLALLWASLLCQLPSRRLHQAHVACHPAGNPDVNEWHIRLMVRQWCMGPPAGCTQPAPNLTQQQQLHWCFDQSTTAALLSLLNKGLHTADTACTKQYDGT